MKIIKKLFIAILVLAILSVLSLFAFDKEYILTALKRTYLAGNATANINDYSEFNVRTIHAAKNPQVWSTSQNYNTPLPEALLKPLQAFDTAAFLITHNNEIVSETYFNDYHKLSKTNSFSMAKTVITLLIGAAIDDGFIDGLDQKITEFFPEFANDPLAQYATIGHLSNMSSGYEWEEHYYSPLSPTVELMYGSDVQAFLLKGKFTSKPGTKHYYSSASTQLLGLLLQRAINKARPQLSVSDYLSEKLWQPLGMNDDAQWHLDTAGTELVFCCLNTNARNYAKLGQLMINKGNWKGQQLISKAFIDAMLTPSVANGETINNYGYSTWLNWKASPGFFWFSGHLGQYIICIPEQNIVIVRLGERRDNSKDFRTTDLIDYVNTALEMVKTN